MMSLACNDKPLKVFDVCLCYTELIWHFFEEGYVIYTKPYFTQLQAGIRDVMLIVTLNVTYKNKSQNYIA